MVRNINASIYLYFNTLLFAAIPTLNCNISTDSENTLELEQPQKQYSTEPSPSASLTDKSEPSGELLEKNLKMSSTIIMLFS